LLKKTHNPGVVHTKKYTQKNTSTLRTIQFSPTPPTPLAIACIDEDWRCECGPLLEVLAQHGVDADLLLGAALHAVVHPLQLGVLTQHLFTITQAIRPMKKKK